MENWESANNLKSCRLFLPLHLLPRLGKDQFYYHDIIGFAVVDIELGKLGTVTAVYSKSGQDLIAMTYQHKEVLIPVTDNIVKSSDSELRELNVALPNGLLEIYLNP